MLVVAGKRQLNFNGEEMKHEYMKRFEEMGVIIRDSHFVYASRKHGPDFVNMEVVFRAVESGSSLNLEVGMSIAEKYKDASIHAVIGPAKGGNVVAQWVKEAINIGIVEVPFQAISPLTFKTSSGNRRFSFGNCQGDLLKFKKVLVVEDVVTSGRSAREVINLVREHGGTVIGVETLCNRDHETAESLGVPFFGSIIDLPLDAYEEDSCPLCKKYGRESVSVEYGHGAEFLAKLARV